MNMGKKERVKIENHLDGESLLESMARDVYTGLTAEPKYLPSKYFYDSRGSRLFELITQLPEYYLTSAECGLLSGTAASLVRELKPRELVELGAGSPDKIRLLLDSLGKVAFRIRYMPFDVDPKAVVSTAEALLDDYPFLSVRGVVGDFERHLDKIPAPKGRRLVLFLGSTIGNLGREEQHSLLAKVRCMLEPGGFLLLGVDLVKEGAMLESAYNDTNEVTAEFNRNVLRVINRRLGANFKPESFHHQAFYNQEDSRIEMHLVSDSSQIVYIQKLGLYVYFRPGETIWTENSYKYTKRSTATTLETGGLRLESWYTDEENLFGLALATPGDNNG